MKPTQHSIRIEGTSADVTVEIAEQTGSLPGIELVTVKWSSPTPRVPSPITLRFEHPIIDIAGRWTPTAGANRSLPPDWADFRIVRSMATQGAPVQSFYSLHGHNRITLAASDAMNVLELGAGVHEETATLHCSLKLFAGVTPPIDRYELTLRIDTRDIPSSEALQSVGQWWEQLPGYAPAAVPDVARRPMYSTWYSFHQKLDVNEVVDECRRAKSLGCEAVIVDDGWQTTDCSRGYAYCGDWDPERIPQMKGFVDAVHATGMKFLLWYSVPFVGKHSRAFAQFQGKFLTFQESSAAGIFDPRFPEVREYLIALYERHLREWDLDGFKLDFVDLFGPAESVGGGRDIDSVPDAADRLLSDIMTRLRAIKPDIMIEFRQSYIGPLMRKYGNLFRAADCPNDFILNRVHTIDVRLLCGGTAAHSDMIMWHPDERVESAALQLIHVLFSVPQISVRLDRIPSEHSKMLKFWLHFWNEHRDVLLDGKFEPLSPASLYPAVRASNSGKAILCFYDDVIGKLDRISDEVYLVNGTRTGRVVIEISEDAGPLAATSFDCTGQITAQLNLHFAAGIHSINIPPAGLGRLRLL